MANPNEVEEDISPEEAASLGLHEEEEDISPEEAASMGLTDAPVQAPPAKTTVGTALGWGAAQGATLFAGDEAAGVLDAGAKAFQRGLNRVQDARTSGNVSDILYNPITEGQKGLKDYRETRDTERARNHKAAEDQPFPYGASQFVGALPAAIATSGLSPALTGAAIGLSASDAELTPDKATPASLKDATTSTVTGAALGELGSRLGGVTKNSLPPIVQQAYPVASKVLTTAAPLALPATGAAIAAFGDRIGVSDADRVTAGLGAASALPGIVTNALEGQGAKYAEKALGARGELTEKVKGLDAKVDARGAKAFEKDQRNAVKGVRAQEDEAFRTGQAATKKADALAGLSKAEQEALTQKEGLAAQKALKEYSARHKGTNQKYKEQIGTWDDEIKALQMVRARRGAELSKREKALAALAEERAGLDKSAQGAYAQSHQSLDTTARRMVDTYERNKMAVPQEATDALKYVDESYIRNGSGRLIYPEEAEKNFRALKDFELTGREKAAQADLESYKAAPFDEDQEVLDLLKKGRGSRVSKNEAYALAKKLGLNPGPFETFQVMPPKGGFGLVEPAPAPGPVLPSAQDKRLGTIQAKREALNAPKAAPTRQDEADILASSGLSRYSPPARESVDKRVGDIVERSVKGIKGKVVDEALTLQRPGLLGARHAIKTMTAVDDMTGKLKNPAAAAGVYTALERVFNKVPALRARYLKGFKEGMRPIQLAFFIKHDPELAKALDDDAQSRAVVPSP